MKVRLNSMKIYNRYMIINNENVDDRSRNGSNAGNPSDGENVTLIKAVEKTAGKRNHDNGYSLDVLANAFKKHHELSECVKCSDEIEQHHVDELFARVADCLDFNVYLHRNVTTRLKGVFTSDQLACIFQAYNGILIKYTGMSDVHAKQELFDYIDYEGKVIYDLGNIEEFKAKIQSMNPIEYDVFANLIIEFWGMDGDMLGLLLNFLRRKDISSNISPN